MAVSLSSLSSVETDRLRIRPLLAADAEAFAAMTNEPAILAAVHFLDDPVTTADAVKLISGDGEGRDCFWGVWDRDMSGLVGTVGTHVHGAEIEIGYWFAAIGQGRGLASEAVRAVVTTLSRACPDHRFVAECRPENAASRRLLERIGFRPDGNAGLRPGRRRFVFVPDDQADATTTPSSAPSITSGSRS